MTPCRSLIAALTVISTALAMPTPSFAMPVVRLDVGAATDLEQVQYHNRRWHDRGHGWRGGYRGHRDYRHGYRRHSGGWWYPLAAFGAGAVIGGAIANANRPREIGINPMHYDWCATRYRTYRAGDNSYVPYAGARAECRSPYF